MSAQCVTVRLGRYDKLPSGVKMTILQIILVMTHIFFLICGYYAGREDGYKEGKAIGYRRGQALSKAVK